MKQQEIEQVISQATAQFSNVQFERISTQRQVKGDKRYCIKLTWEGRVVILGRFRHWESLRQAWQVLNEGI